MREISTLDLVNLSIHFLGFHEKICAAGLMPPFRSIGGADDNSVMESCWSTMQIELLSRKK